MPCGMRRLSGLCGRHQTEKGAKATEADHGRLCDQGSTQGQSVKQKVEGKKMISIKMIDGTRYDTAEIVDGHGTWVVVQDKGKTVYLNTDHIVSITEKGEGG